jgi:hypothetical protein
VDTTSDSPHARPAGIQPALVSIRPLERSDLDALVALHRRLSPRALRCRFFTTHPDLSRERIARLLHADDPRHVGLVALVGDRLAGVACYDRGPQSDDANVTLVVDDTACDQDVDVLLLQGLAAIARRKGIRRLELMVSPIDRQLIEILDESAFDVVRRYHSGIVTITVRLDPQA